jgi:hypothetical protein
MLRHGFPPFLRQAVGRTSAGEQATAATARARTLAPVAIATSRRASLKSLIAVSSRGVVQQKDRRACLACIGERENQQGERTLGDYKRSKHAEVRSRDADELNSDKTTVYRKNADESAITPSRRRREDPIPAGTYSYSAT